MSAEAAVLTRSWPVGSRRCTLTVPQAKPGAVMAANSGPLALDETADAGKGAPDLENAATGHAAALADRLQRCPGFDPRP